VGSFVDGEAYYTSQLIIAYGGAAVLILPDQPALWNCSVAVALQARATGRRMEWVEKSGTVPYGKVKTSYRSFKGLLGNALVGKKVKKALGGSTTTILCGAAKCKWDSISLTV
jgi:long-subunit acyl-CoA synthetase (AMP-forming)